MLEIIYLIWLHNRRILWYF